MTPVSELLALKIENLCLKLTQLQAQGTALIQERDAIIKEARAEVHAPDGHIYNTDTRQFQAPQTPTPFRAPAARERKRVAAS